MEEYISKSALMTEIKRRLRLLVPKMTFHQQRVELEKLLSFIDTLEVKSADLEEEIKEVQRDYKTIEEYEGYPCTMYANDIEWIARHFFELRLKAKGN